MYKKDLIPLDSIEKYDENRDMTPEYIGSVFAKKYDKDGNLLSDPNDFLGLPKKSE